MLDPELRPALYVFTWPSFLGGADTKTAHLLKLLRDDFRITVVPNFPHKLQEAFWTSYLDRLGISYATLDMLPDRLEGVALALCNDLFFSTGICRRLKERGLRVIWSSEMMYHHEGEREAIEEGLVDRLLYVSEVQKSVLDYESFTDVATFMTGNYIDPDEFPFRHRDHEQVTIGRLSRADPLKYPEDFPVFYEALEIPDVRFRVMAWSDQLTHKYRWHHFDERWELLRPFQERAIDFLYSLDVFVYPLGHRFTESWGRSTVEAMLTGAVPLVPRGHHFENLIVHGETGFICDDFLEYQEHAHRLCREEPLRRQMALAARQHAEQNLCDRDFHLKLWCEALDV